MIRRTPFTVILLLLAASCVAWTAWYWVNPTGFEDPGSEWSTETNAYDDNSETYTTSEVENEETTSSVVFTLNTPIRCDAVRYEMTSEESWITSTTISVYYGNAWHGIYDGGDVDGAFTKTISAGPQMVSKMSITATNEAGEDTDTVKIAEVDFRHAGWPRLRARYGRAGSTRARYKK